MSGEKVIVLATRNQGKISELSDLLKNFGLDVRGLSDFPQIRDIEETGRTFVENALIKAQTVSKALDLVAVADDSGLEVDALNGAPGVYSARYAGPNATDAQNNARLLRELTGIPFKKRTARFRCAMVAFAPGGEHILAQGAWEGRIALEPAGNQGFGYDPLFLDRELEMTAAQMTRNVKNARSHRGKALRDLLAKWPRFWSRAFPGK